MYYRVTYLQLRQFVSKKKQRSSTKKKLKEEEEENDFIALINERDFLLHTHNL